MWGGVVGVCIASGIVVARSDGDVGNWLISVAVLVVAAIALEAVLPSHGRLLVERQEELDLSDLIFYVYPQPAEAGQRQVPRDYLLQLHVAIANVGKRKVVLSRLTIESFLTESGNRIHLPEGVQGPIRAHRWTQSRTSGNLFAGPPHPVAHQEGPPFTFEPDDVETLRFRMRRGIDWAPKWTLDKLREYAELLADPIVGVEGEITYRRGRKVVRQTWSTPIRVTQQDLYVRLIGEITRDFTDLPEVPHQSIVLE